MSFVELILLSISKYEHISLIPTSITCLNLLNIIVQAHYDFNEGIYYSVLVQ